MQDKCEKTIISNSHLIPLEKMILQSFFVQEELCLINVLNKKLYKYLKILWSSNEYHRIF